MKDLRSRRRFSVFVMRSTHGPSPLASHEDSVTVRSLKLPNPRQPRKKLHRHLQHRNKMLKELVCADISVLFWTREGEYDPVGAKVQLEN